MPTVNKISRPWIKPSESQSEKKTDPFYHSPPWRKLRAYHLSLNPMCWYCLLFGRRHIPPVSYVDHFRPRKLYPELSLDQENLRTACEWAHNFKRAWERLITTKEQFESKINELLERFIKHNHNTR